MGTIVFGLKVCYFAGLFGFLFAKAYLYWLEPIGLTTWVIWVTWTGLLRAPFWPLFVGVGELW